jgi:hypothetical protein
LECFWKYRELHFAGSFFPERACGSGDLPMQKAAAFSCNGFWA